MTGEPSTWEEAARQSREDFERIEAVRAALAAREAAGALLYDEADLQAARTEGRAEANAAIDWQTSCLGCAGRMTDLARERAEGGQETAALIVAELRRLHATLGDPVLLHAVDAALGHTGTSAPTGTDATMPS